MARFNSVQLRVTDLAATKSFYAGAFGWAFTDYGTTYSTTTTGDVELGLQGGGAEADAVPLAVIQVDDLDAALAAVGAAGGTISLPVFEFPGGRGFHFKDPSGNELAVSQDDPAP
jgi:predicted enzyme related to lactoylglutathione lyase